MEYDDKRKAAELASQAAEVAPLEPGREIRLKPPIVPEFLRMAMQIDDTKPGVEFHQEQTRPAGRGLPKAEKEGEK